MRETVEGVTLGQRCDEGEIGRFVGDGAVRGWGSCELDGKEGRDTDVRDNQSELDLDHEGSVNMKSVFVWEVRRNENLDGEMQANGSGCKCLA